MRNSDKEKQETRIGKENQLTKEYHPCFHWNWLGIHYPASYHRQSLPSTRRENMSKREKKMSSQYRYVSWLAMGGGGWSQYQRQVKHCYLYWYEEDESMNSWRYWRLFRKSGSLPLCCHCDYALIKKRLGVFPGSQPGCHLFNSSWPEICFP